MPLAAKFAQILGVKIDIVDWETIEKFCREALIQAAPKTISTVNGEIILIASKNQQYRQVLNGSSLAIADSTNVIWIGRLLGYKFPYRTPGSELVPRLCAIAEQMQKSVFLLGGKDDAAEKSADKLQEKYPNLDIVGFSNADPDDPDIVHEIRRKNPDIVFVAYGAPKQEMWINENKEELTAKIMVGVGGTFDMISGRLARAPGWMQRAHLEWLWRLYLEPRRFVRIIKAIIIFPVKAILLNRR